MVFTPSICPFRRVFYGISIQTQNVPVFCCLSAINGTGKSQWLIGLDNRKIQFKSKSDHRMMSVNTTKLALQKLNAGICNSCRVTKSVKQCSRILVAKFVSELFRLIPCLLTLFSRFVRFRTSNPQNFKNTEEIVLDVRSDRSFRLDLDIWFVIGLDLVHQQLMSCALLHWRQRSFLQIDRKIPPKQTYHQRI